MLTKWFFVLKARHVGNKVLLISLFQRRHGVNKMGLFLCKEVGLGSPPNKQSNSSVV